METSKIDASHQGAAGTKSKPAKSAREAFSDLLLSQFDRIAKGAEDDTGAEETFFQAKPRPVSKDLPLDKSEEPAREDRRGEKSDRDQDAIAYAQAALERRPVDTAGKDAEPSAKAAAEPVAEAAASAPPQQQAQAKPQAPTQAKPNPNAQPQAQQPTQPQAQANGANGAGPQPQVQVTVGQAPVQAQAAQPLANGAAALKAQEIEGGDHGAAAPGPGGVAGVTGPATGQAGDGTANGGFDANGNTGGQPGLGTLAAAIAFGNINVGAAGAAGVTGFAAQLDQQAPEAPEPVTVGALAGTTAPSATATAASARRAPEGSPQLPRLAAMEQIAINIQKAVAQGKDTVTIQLRPEDLGRIDVKLEVGKDGQVQAHVRAEKPETLELLQRDARGLERALQDAGLRTDSGSLSFGLRGENRNPDGQTGQQNQQSSRVAPELAADVEAMAPVIAAQSVDGRVDVHV